MYIPSFNEKVNSREEFELWAFGSVNISIIIFVASVYMRSSTDLFKIKTTSLSSNEIKFLVLFFILAICLRFISSKKDLTKQKLDYTTRTKSLISTFILTAIFLQVIWA
jgi:multisubunit Na+/H+ antiporter MnhC subunit